MKKILVFLMMSAVFVVADIGTSTQNSNSDQKSVREGKQYSEQESSTKNRTYGEGSEKSYSKTLSTTLSKIASNSNTVTHSASGTLSLNTNPIPYMLDELRKLGWNSKAFFLTFDELGIGTYVVAEDEEFGELQNVGKLEAMRNEASRSKRLTRTQSERIGQHINLMYNTAELMKVALLNMQNLRDLSIDNLEGTTRLALQKAYQETQARRINITDCNYGGDMNTYACNSGKFTLILTNSVPTLLVDGTPYYSATSIAHMSPSLQMSFASSTQDAFSKITQDQRSNSVAGMVRDYTSKLEQNGQSEMAQKIKNKFVEHSLTKGTTNNTSATINAINSGSPTAVLKIFQ